VVAGALASRVAGFRRFTALVGLDSMRLLDRRLDLKLLETLEQRIALRDEQTGRIALAGSRLAHSGANWRNSALRMPSPSPSLSTVAIC
jgi:hypothetical protein